ncbi:MAG: class A beta-lactamase-related serine hydrolase [Gemmatimonadetes bacterium]|nr:class A beta-lactamase-related serine hydrolase [Gemmatimonadota bacterium]
MTAALRTALVSLMALGAAGERAASADVAAPRGPDAGAPVAPGDTVTALTLLKDRAGWVPLPGGMRVLSVSIATAYEASVFAPFDAELRACGMSVEYARIEPEGMAPASLAEAVARAEMIVVSTYAESLQPEVLQTMRRISAGRPLVLMAFNQRVIPTAAGLEAYLVAPGASPDVQRSAARGLAGAEPINGQLAADLGPHRAGEGMRREGQAEAVGLPRTARGMPMAVNFVEVDPADAGMDEATLDRLDELVRAELADSAAPGAALAIGRRGKIVRLRGYGTLDYADDRSVSPATLFDLASLTKVVATTPALMILEGEGKLDLEAPAARYLPWFAKSDRRKARITVRQLLLHRTGFAAFRPWYRDHEGAQAYRDAIAKEPLQSDPGARTVYSDMNFMVLGFVVEAVAGMPLDRFAAERVFGPLGMEDTGFKPDPSMFPRIAPTEVDTVFRHTHVRGVVHDENAYAMGGVAGHAGLFSTVWDLAAYADLMLSDGLLDACEPAAASGVACTRPRADTTRILPAAAVERWTVRPDAASSQALGWDTPEGASSSAGVFFSDRAYGHTGFTGTSIWIDPELDLYVVLLTNRVDPSRDNQRHMALRRAVADAAARAIRDRVVERRR